MQQVWTYLGNKVSAYTELVDYADFLFYSKLHIHIMFVNILKKKYYWKTKFFKVG